MKKLLIKATMISCFASSIVSANTIKINNTTDSIIHVAIDYVAPDICSPDRVSISPHSPLIINAGGCCTKSDVRFNATFGDLKGIEVLYHPSRSGASVTCKGWDAEIKPSGDTFVVETR